MQPNEPTSHDPAAHEPSRDPAQQPGGYQAPQQGGYSAPQQGAFAAPQPGAGGRPPMPAVVKWGLGIQWVGIALTALLILIGFAGIAVLAGVGADSSETSALVGIAIAMLAVGLVLVAVQVLFLIFATKGRNWARWALAVVAAIGLVISLVSGQGVNFGTIVSVVAVVLLFLPDANAWYSAADRSR